MHLTIFQILAFTVFFACSLARKLRLPKQSSDVIVNRSVEVPVGMTKRDDTKYVFMHHLRRISDALALNIGSNDWEPKQVANAYAGAKKHGTNFKMFISLDYTSLSCEDPVPNAVSLCNQFANHPNQFKVDGRPMISSYEGGCLKNTGWESLKTQTNGYIMPFISKLEGNFPQWTALDSWYCWGCCFPKNDQNISTAGDLYYLDQLGDKYATTVSGWMFAHFDNKNMFQSDGDWLLNTRWEQLVSLRDKLTFVEMVTWNDFGESDYFGPVTSVGNEPWVGNFSHTKWYEMSEYYITAFKTGSYPAITIDVIYFWARPHPAKATATSDPLPRPSGGLNAEDTMWAAAFVTSKATVTLQCGSSSSTFPVTPGVNKLKIPLAEGEMSVKMVRNGQTIISETAQDNYNAWVGSATSIADTGTHTSTTSTAPTTSTASSSTRSSRSTSSTSSKYFSSSPSTETSSAPTATILRTNSTIPIPSPQYTPIPTSQHC